MIGKGGHFMHSKFYDMPWLPSATPWGCLVLKKALGHKELLKYIGS